MEGCSFGGVTCKGEKGGGGGVLFSFFFNIYMCFPTTTAILALGLLAAGARKGIVWLCSSCTVRTLLFLLTVPDYPA